MSEALYVCRKRTRDGAIIVREAEPGENGVPHREAFCQAKRLAGWHREIPNEEGK